MKVKIDVRDDRLVDWLLKNVGAKNFKFDVRTEEIEFMNEDDFLTFRLKFQESGPNGFFYAPNIPDFDYKPNFKP